MVLIRGTPLEEVFFLYLASLAPKFDVIIIYDRMRQQKDLITGNNVTKLYVINSNRDFEESQKMLGIKATDTIISGPESSIPNALDIKTIPGYLHGGRQYCL